MFDDELYSNLSFGAEDGLAADSFGADQEGDPDEDDDDGWDGAGPFDFEDDDPRLSERDASAASSGRRSRGSRGAGKSQKRWRSGQIPAPPAFSGDIENDPFCLRHYTRALKRWTTITKEYLPKNEQALRALDALTGDAALELEEVDDSRYNQNNGIEVLLADLSVSFGEKEVFRKGGLIREFESLVRLQGESVTAFVRRFRLMERKLQDAKIPQYPSETRAVKLLDGLRLDERATSQLLLAAGNKYEFQALVDAVRVQFPAGLTLTGMARHPQAVSTNRNRGRGQHRGRGRSHGFKYKVWQTTTDADDPYADGYATALEEFPEHETNETYDNDETFDYEYIDEAEADQEADDDAAPAEQPDESEQIQDDDAAQALTATSKRMASTVQSRGYYVNSTGRGKGKSQQSGAPSSSKDGNKGATQTASSNGKGKGGKPFNKGKNGPKGRGKGNAAQQRYARQAGLCLGCNSPDHFLRDCPNVTQHQAHICSAPVTLDGDGMVVWMANVDDDESFVPRGWDPEDWDNHIAWMAMQRMDVEGYIAHLREQERDQEMPSFMEVMQNSSEAPVPEGWNPDDWQDYLDRQAMLRQDVENYEAEFGIIGAASVNPASFSPLHCSVCSCSLDRSLKSQDWEEDPRTSRAVCYHCWSADPQLSGQEQGEDLRTSTVTSSSAEGSKQEQAGDLRTPKVGPETKELREDHGKETQGLQTPHLADTASPSVLHFAPAAMAPAASLSSAAQADDSGDFWDILAISAGGHHGGQVHFSGIDGDDLETTDVIFRAPPLLMSYMDEPCLAIVDTGCQRQVAGQRWHLAHLENIGLPRVTFPERCQFRFGPSGSTRSVKRYAYPAGVGGNFTVMLFSCVESDAPALMSRQTMTVLDAVPDITAGVIHYRALQSSSTLYLSSCGHLAVRLDEWPSSMPDWPCELQFHDKHLPDVWAPSASQIVARELPSARHPAVVPPGHAKSFASSEMVETLARAPSSPLQPGDECDQGGDVLCGHEFEANAQGQDFGSVLSSEHSNHYAVHHGSPDRAEQSQSDQVPQRPRGVRTSAWSENLWGSRAFHQDLRHVRFSRSGGQGPVEESCSKGKSVFKDAAGSPTRSGQIKGKSQSQRQGSSQGKFIGLKSIVLWLGTFLAFLSGLLLGTTTIDSLDGADASRSGEASEGSFGLPESRFPRCGFSTELGASESELGGAGAGSTFQDSSLGQPGLRLGSTPRTCRGGPGGGRSLSGLQPRGRDGGGAPSGVDHFDRPLLSGSADQPLTFEDHGFSLMRPGRQKRFLHTAKSLRQIWMVENTIYYNLVQSNRVLRRCKADLLEVYGGHANITRYAQKVGLRALQPVDKIYGINLSTRDDFQQFRQLVRRHRPFLTVFEPECRLWSTLTNLNYYWRPEELAELRKAAMLTVEETANHIEEIILDGRFFLLENPHGSELWNQEPILRLQQKHSLFYDHGHMCAYELLGKDGYPLKKATGWLSNHPVLLKSVTKKCAGNHEHEECIGVNAKLAAVYTPCLARSLVKSLMEVLRDLGDERFRLASSYPTTTQTTTQMDYLNLDQDVDNWRPLLKEAAERLEGKVAVSAVVKPSAYLEQIKQLVPWHLEFVQIYRTPKTRRLPTRRMLESPNITHRGAALLFQDGTIEVESQAVSEVDQPQTRFDRTVRVAIFLYGKPMNAPNVALRPSPSKPSTASTPIQLEPEDGMADWEPSAKDITFPGVSEDQIPNWMRSVLKRVHTNLGHPHNSTLVRQLSQAHASPAAMIGARALRCAVCERLRPPKEARTAKVLPMTRRFNERLMLDLIFAKDIAGETFISRPLIRYSHLFQAVRHHRSSKF